MNIITGLQATGDLHIGNYFGAILPMIEKSKQIQSTDKLYLFVPDLHSLTIDIDYSTFYQNILNNVRVYLACGLPQNQHNITVFRQSFVPAHSQMQWLLSCFSYFGEMSRMTQFKDKSKDHDSNINLGLFSYPVLMAGDILLYDALYVPIGEDQVQHLELCRDLAIRINNKFNKQIFVIPKNTGEQMEFIGYEKALRIRSLSNPEKKMSKSSPDEKSKIMLTDEPAKAIKKIMSATTDSLENISWNWETQPGITNLLQLFSILSGKSKEETILEWSGQKQYGPLKKAVAELISQFLTEFQTNLATISNQDVIKALTKGEIQANIQANHTLLRFQKSLGLHK